MFWLFVPVALVGIAAAIASSISEDERAARRRWESKNVEVERTVEEHRKNIEEHIAGVQHSYDFYFLCELHYSSYRVADSAYRLLEDARASLDSIGKILDKTTAKREELKKCLSTANGQQRKELLAEIGSLREFKANLLEDYKRLKGQRDAFHEEVRRLNEQTRNLKETIRDRCGEKGVDWYLRLEHRASARRVASGKYAKSHA